MTAALTNTIDELLEITGHGSPRSAKADARDRALLGAACDLRAFTTTDVVSAAAGTSSQVFTSHPWYGTTSALLRALHAAGRLQIVSPEGARPIVYEWVDGTAPCPACDGTGRVSA